MQRDFAKESVLREARITYQPAGVREGSNVSPKPTPYPGHSDGIRCPDHDKTGVLRAWMKLGQWDTESFMEERIPHLPWIQKRLLKQLKSADRRLKTNPKTLIGIRPA